MYALGNNALRIQEGYQPIRRSYFMVRPDLENITDLELPEGLGTRPARPAHYRQISDASQEAFQDHWSHNQPTEVDYQKWQQSKFYRNQ